MKPTDPPAAPGALTRRARDFVVAPLRAAEDEAAAYRASAAGRRPDRKALAVLVSAALLLTAQFSLTRDEYLAWQLVEWLAAHGFDRAADMAYRVLLGRGLDHWVGFALTTAVWFLLAPALIVALGFRERLADYGLKLRGAFADAWVYVAMLAVVGPLVFAASYNKHFQETYPFFRPAGRAEWPELLCWELAYALQFLAVEFFFRGFLVHGLRRRFGAYCIPIMTIPYCMVHFGKPLPETLASVAAGLALGFMSLRTRSIFLGTAIHLTVAWSMDLASLWQQGWFG
jgi:membrane protease YdiL (CAAX protease family)